MIKANKTIFPRLQIRISYSIKHYIHKKHIFSYKHPYKKKEILLLKTNLTWIGVERGMEHKQRPVVFCFSWFPLCLPEFRLCMARCTTTTTTIIIIITAPCRARRAPRGLPAELCRSATRVPVTSRRGAIQAPTIASTTCPGTIRPC